MISKGKTIKLSKSTYKSNTNTNSIISKETLPLLLKIKDSQKLQPLFELSQSKFNEYIKNKEFILSLIEIIPKECSFIYNVMDSSLKHDKPFLLKLIQKYPQFESVIL